MKARLTRAILTLVISTAVLGSSAAFEQEVTIRYRWTKGETLRYRITSQVHSVMSGLPGGMADVELQQTATQELQSTVEDVSADGTATLRQSFESMKMEFISPAGRMTFDSGNPQASTGAGAEMLAKILSAMVGEPFTVVVAPTGGVQRLEGLGQIFEKMFKDVPSGPMAAGGINMIKAALGDDAMRGQIEQGFAQFPPRAVKVGETWDRQTSTKNPVVGAITMSIATTLDGIDTKGSDQFARLTTRTIQKRDASAPAIAIPSGANVQMGESVAEGEILFDLTRGRPVRVVTRATLPMTMTGTAPDGTAMNVSNNMKTTVTVELIQ